MKAIPSSKIRCTDPVDIPDSAFEVKDRFKERLSDAEVEAIRDEIRETQAPHLWSGHTHTPPPKNPRIVYLGEYGLSEDHAAPCPCCSPRHAKYFRSGMIVWFPDECVIRLMGWKCFRSMAPDVHAAAIKQYREEQERKKDIDFLLRNYHLATLAVRAIDANLPVAEAFEDFQGSLHRVVYDRLDMQLWRYIRTGELQMEENGSFRRFSGIEGHRILSEPIKSVTKRLRAARSLLVGIDPCVLQGDVDTLSDKERAAAAKAISRGLNEAGDAVREIEDMRRFVGVLNTSTLRSWGKHPGCPYPIYIRRTNQMLKIGKVSEERALSLNIPAKFDEELKPIPELIAASFKRSRKGG